MKKIAIIWLCMMVFTTCLNAQKRNLLKINPLSPFTNTINIQYETAINKESSFGLGFFYRNDKTTKENIRGVGITPEYRLYFSEDMEAPTGFYLAPFVRIQSLKSTITPKLSDNKTYDATFFGIRPGLLVGYQWIFSDKVSFDAFVGTTYSFHSINIDSDDYTEEDFSFTDHYSIDSKSNYGVRAGLTIGIKLGSK